MKKIIIFLIFILTFSITVSAQTSFGKYVMYPDAGLVGSLWKPQMNFCHSNGANFIVVCSTASDTYYTFSEDSRILFRFADSTVVKLPIVPELTQTDYKASWIGSSLVNQYMTFSFYEIDDNTLNKIIIEHIPIIKIRVTYSNGTIREHEIKTNYQSKFIKGLCESYNLAITENDIRKKNSNDDDF